MFNALGFFKLADKFKLSTDESEIRTAISRAYYAAFLISREWVRTKGWRIYDDGNDHREVPNGLQINQRRLAGSKLRSLRRHRRNADYVLTRSVNNNDANYAVNLAKNVINEIYPKSLP
jgi:uncharacterized protein (UPF0332 family)